MPAAVFLDTSVLAGQQYNFASTALTTFTAAAKSANLKLILPDPTEREVKRQIRDRSKEALDALEIARRRAPFLAKWSSFPKRTDPNLENWEVARVATTEWNIFLKQFDVIRLGYEQVDVKTVMNWYDAVTPPFGEGKKRKEFPDAFAISILDIYSEKSGSCIAVVSEDQDFKLACERFSNLLYFKSLPRPTELLISKDDIVQKMHSAIEDGLDVIESEIQNKFDALGYRHAHGFFEIHNSKNFGAEVSEINIVALGDNECTATFDVRVEHEHDLQWEEYRGPDEPPDYVSEWVGETTHLTGTAKLAFDVQNSKLTGVKHVVLDADEIEIEAMPRRY